jgi:hypothetical protein
LLISDDSPLRRLPSDLNQKQKFYLDGIRFSIEIIDLTYTRLKETLYNLSNNIRYNSKTNHLIYLSAIHDVWSLIDSLYRLRGLLQLCPGIKQKSPGMILFYNNIRNVELFRHSIQHLNTQINELIKLNLPVWGIITWTAVLNRTSNSVFSCAIIAGTIFHNQCSQIINPAGKELVIPIDLITLTAGGHSICLSKVFDEINKLTKTLEAELAKRFKDLPCAGADLLLFVEFTSASNQLNEIN